MTNSFKGRLLQHQIEALEKLKSTDALLLYHSLGAGKTATSIAASSGDKTDVVVPASLRGNYQKEVDKFTDDIKNIMSYNKFTKDGPSIDGDTLVMDEIQRVGRRDSAMSQKAVEYAPFYKKRILLSGTPASNSPEELAPIIRMLSPNAKEIPLDPALFKQRFMGERKIPVSFFQSIRGLKPGVEYYPINTDKIQKAISGKVHYYQSSKDEYPERIDLTKEVEASKEQANIYKYVTESSDPIVAMKVRMNLPLSKKELSQINAFMTAARQVSNSTKAYGGKEELSNKLKQVVSDIKDKINENENHKSLVYSNYLESGINDIENELAKENIPYSRFDGSMSDRARKIAIDNYNSNKSKALLVSSSGAEGLDLKGTRAIHVLEPHWNKNRIEQLIGRGIRYKSHSHLPENERNVEVIKYRTVLPKSVIQKLFNKDRDVSSDRYLDELSDKKQELLDKYLSIFKEEGSMNKQALLEKTYNSAFKGELEKIALSGVEKAQVGVDDAKIKLEIAKAMSENEKIHDEAIAPYSKYFNVNRAAAAIGALSGGALGYMLPGGRKISGALVGAILGGLAGVNASDSTLRYVNPEYAKGSDEAARKFHESDYLLAEKYPNHYYD